MNTIIFHNDNSTAAQTLKRKLVDRKLDFVEVSIPKRKHNTFTRNTVLEVDGQQLGLVDSLNWVNEHGGTHESN